jgi:hypothetical protein
VEVERLRILWGAGGAVKDDRKHLVQIRKAMFSTPVTSLEVIKEPRKQ